MNAKATRLLAALLAAASCAAHAQRAEDYLRHRWYRIDMVIFAPTAVADAEPARPSQLESMRLPRLAVPLAESPGERSADQMPFGPEPPVDDEPPFFVSNLAPPTWFAGECAGEFWTPPLESLADGGFAPDPCLAEPEPETAVDVDAEPPADADESLAPVEPPPPPDPRQALADAVREHENTLLATSYEWRYETSAFSRDLRRLRQRFAVIAAGSWHQPLPPRDEPARLLVQVGAMDADRRFDLEGWIGVAVGRRIHFEAQLQYRLPDGQIALLSERRAMRSKTRHYFDHPALGMLVWAERLTMPPHIDELVAEARRR